MTGQRKRTDQCMYYSPTEAAEVLGVDVSTVYKMLDGRLLPFRRTKAKGKYLIPCSAITQQQTPQE